MAMLDPSKRPEFSHPLAWAPFVLAGEGGAGRQLSVIHADTSKKRPPAVVLGSAIMHMLTD